MVKRQKNRQHNGQKTEEQTRQHNGQKKKDKKTNNDLQNIHKVTRTPLKAVGEIRYSGKVNSSCSTSDTHRVNLIHEIWYDYDFYFQFRSRYEETLGYDDFELRKWLKGMCLKDSLTVQW